MEEYGSLSQDVTLFASAARVVAQSPFEGSTIDVVDGKKVIVALIDVTAKGGTTPTLDVKLQESVNAGASWTDVALGAFTQFADAVGKKAITALLVSRAVNAVRGHATVVGTNGTFTFSVVATVIS